MTDTSLLAVYQELRADWSAREPALSKMGGLGRAAWSEWAGEGDAFGLELPYPTWVKTVTADLIKVGPKGYIHGWIYVGPAKLTHPFEVHHPELGRGVMTRRGSKTVGIQFDSGYHAFEHKPEAPGVGGSHFIGRPGHGSGTGPEERAARDASRAAVAAGGQSARIERAREAATHSWSGNPYSAIRPMEALTGPDWRAMSDEDRTAVREALARLQGPRRSQPGDEIHTRAGALAARLEAAAKPATPELTGHAARDTQIRSGWKVGDRLIHRNRGPVIYGGPDDMDSTGRAGGGSAHHVEFDDGSGGMVSADMLSGYVPPGAAPKKPETPMARPRKYTNAQKLRIWDAMPPEERNRWLGLGKGPEDITPDVFPPGLPRELTHTVPRTPTPAEHYDRLHAMSSRDEARQYVAGIKGKELQALADHLSVSRGPVGQRREGIVHATVGARLDSAAMRGGNWLERLPPPATTVPVEQLKHGNYAEVVGEDQYGKPITLRGYVSQPTGVRIGARGRKKRDAVAVQVTETPGGANGWRGVAYVAPGTHVTPLSATRSTAEVKDRVRAAYDARPKAPGGWVGLADLRDDLGDLNRGEVDAALGELAREPGVRVAPVDNTRALRSRDRAAAVRLGDSDRHMIAMGRGNTAPTPGIQPLTRSGVEPETDAHGTALVPGDTVTIATTLHNRTDQQATVLDIGTARVGGHHLATVRFADGTTEQVLPGNVVRARSVESAYLANLSREMEADPRFTQPLRGKPATSEVLRTLAGAQRGRGYEAAVLQQEARRHRGTPLGDRLSAAATEVELLRRGNASPELLDRVMPTPAPAAPVVSPRMEAEALRVHAAARQRALDAGLPAAGSTSRRHHTPAGPVGTGQGATTAEWQRRLEQQQQVDEMRARADQLAATPAVASEVTRAAEDRILAMDRPGAPTHIRETAAAIRERRTPTVSAEDAARTRQAHIDRARAVGGVVAEAHELVNHGASPQALRARITAHGNRVGVDTTHLATLADDPPTLLAAADHMATQAGLERVGSAGEVVPFNRGAHDPFGQPLREGSQVEIVRPGHVATLPGGERVPVSRATVQPAGTPDVPARVAIAPRGRRPAAVRAAETPPSPAGPVQYQVVQVNNRGQTTAVLGHAGSEEEALALRQHHIDRINGGPENQRRRERRMPIVDAAHDIKIEERVPGQGQRLDPITAPKPTKLGPTEAAQEALQHLRAGGDTETTLKALPVAALRELARLHGIVGTLGGRDEVKRMKKPDLVREMTPWLS